MAGGRRPLVWPHCIHISGCTALSDSSRGGVDGSADHRSRGTARALLSDGTLHWCRRARSGPTGLLLADSFRQFLGSYPASGCQYLGRGVEWFSRMLEDVHPPRRPLRALQYSRSPAISAWRVGPVDDRYRFRGVAAPAAERQPVWLFCFASSCVIYPPPQFDTSDDLAQCPGHRGDHPQ